MARIPLRGTGCVRLEGAANQAARVGPRGVVNEDEFADGAPDGSERQPEGLAEVVKLPNGEHAVVDLSKLRNSCLNKGHPQGRHKARQFLSALG